jgi:pyridoxine 5'-phosphate synthase PdxJ
MDRTNKFLTIKPMNFNGKLITLYVVIWHSWQFENRSKAIEQLVRDLAADGYKVKYFIKKEMRIQGIFTISIVTEDADFIEVHSGDFEDINRKLDLALKELKRRIISSLPWKSNK